VITSLAGRPITTDRDVDRTLAGVKRGQAVPVEAWRRGQTFSLTLRF
jgi:S1-C subfamily serine protease